MNNYRFYLKEGVDNIGGSRYSQNADTIIAYSDLTSKERKDLDDYCLDNYGETFLDCSWEEQSTARSIIWGSENPSDDVAKQDKINKEI